LEGPGKLVGKTTTFEEFCLGKGGGQAGGCKYKKESNSFEQHNALGLRRKVTFIPAQVKSPPWVYRPSSSVVPKVILSDD